MGVGLRSYGLKGDRNQMKPSILLSKNRDRVLSVIQQYNVVNPRIIGSVARGDDTDNSDLDLLVSIIPDKTTLVDLYGIVDDLEELLGIHVDIITESSIPPEQRAVILKEAISV